jgi:hypothetical protein
MLRARAKKAGTWETFTAHCLTPGRFAIWADDGPTGDFEGYVTVETTLTGSRQGMLRVRRTTRGPTAAQVFSWEPIGGSLGRGNLKSNLTKNYISAEFSNPDPQLKGMLRSRPTPTVRGEWEEFIWGWHAR